MNEPIQNQEINYQPQAQSYVYRQNSAPQPKKLLNIKLIIFLLIICIVLGITFSAFYFLKSQVTNSQQSDTAVPIFNAKNNTWTTTGQLEQYNDNLLKIKTGGRIMDFVFSYENSSFFKQIMVQTTGSTPSSYMQNILYTLYDLDQKENLGKTFTIIYVTDKSGINNVQTITLVK